MTTVESGSDTVRFIGQRVLRPRQQVEEHIRSAILEGSLKSGERLPSESELARQFDVSRTTVREALRSLSTQNLIRKIPGAGGGSFVRSVDHSSLTDAVGESMSNLLALGNIDFEEVALVRQHLEVPAVRLASLHRSPEDLATLQDIVARQKVISIDDPDVPQLDKDFHGTIANASGNRVLASLIVAVHRETEPVHYLDLSPEVGRNTVKQHQKILRAVDAQDADAAELAMIEHLTYLRKHFVAYRKR